MHHSPSSRVRNALPQAIAASSSGLWAWTSIQYPRWWNRHRLSHRGVQEARFQLARERNGPQPPCVVEKMIEDVEFVKFVTKFFRRQFFPQFTPETERSCGLFQPVALENEFHDLPNRPEIVDLDVVEPHFDLKLLLEEDKQLHECHGVQHAGLIYFRVEGRDLHIQ